MNYKFSANIDIIFNTTKYKTIKKITAQSTNPVDGEETPYFSFTHASPIRK